MQDINSSERYELFTQAVLESAEREAAALITGAEKEKADMLRAAAHSVAEDEYQRLTAKAEHESVQLKAHCAQELRRDLLTYRESLCNELINKIAQKCMAFCESEAYESFIASKLEANKAFISEGGVTAYVREKDTELLNKLATKYDGLKVCADNEILLGGVRLTGTHKIFDETLDTGLAEEKESFLSYCGLKVV